MRIKNTKFKIICAAIIIILVFSSAALVISGFGSENPESNIESTEASENSSSNYITETGSPYWDNFKAKELSKEKVLELYNEGYGIQDIEKAQSLAAICDKTVEEILAIKGTTIDYLRKQDKSEETQEETPAVNNAKSWDEVIKKLDFNRLKFQEKTQEEIDIRTEKLFKKKYDITDTEIEKYKKEGISVRDIGYSKELAKRYGKNYEDILKLKKLKGNWKDTIAEIGGQGQ